MTHFIVEADGASRGNPGHASFGSVVRNAQTGGLVAEIGGVLGHATNNVAEYRGLIAGLEAVAAIDAQAIVEVRMDSKLVVEQMSGRWAIKNAGLRELAMVAREILPFSNVTYTWIPREDNKAADALANQALDEHLAGGSGVIIRNF
ncbi:MAG: reverse transcriptase-like protein [Actinobacteria bacterium]|nr:reverse transcriptase-like protein [Actinomycetota bacterium]NBY15726.1 reverse transcriptase-like protein [Actinomycetota bacterium]